MSASSFSRGLIGLVRFDLRFETITGLLIRMPVQAQAYRIGGADLYPMVARIKYRVGGNVRDLEVPYVPGSSLKGRMRGLLELSMGARLYSADRKIWQHVRSLAAMGPNFFDDVRNRCVIDELFGWAAANYRQLEERLRSQGQQARYQVNDVYSMLAPTRLLVSEFYPAPDYVESIDAKSVADFLEEKSENRIDRITSAADPRSIVRVKPGVVFEGAIKMLLFDHDADMVARYLKTLATGLRLLEETYLGSSGSRGYGRIRFTRISISVYKLDTSSGAPRLVPADIKKEYGSAEEFNGDAEKIAKTIVEKLYATEGEGR